MLNKTTSYHVCYILQPYNLTAILFHEQKNEIKEETVFSFKLEAKTLLNCMTLKCKRVNGPDLRRQATAQMWAHAAVGDLNPSCSEVVG